MKYHYEFGEFLYKDGDKDLTIVVEDKIQLVSVFLMSDYLGPNSKDEVINTIDKVLKGESEYEELSGNVCLVKVYKDKSIIYDKLAEDGKGDWCEIETTELREFVEIWRDEVGRFYKKHCVW